MSNLFVQESFVNETNGHRFGDSEVYETYTDSRKRLFRDMQREYGRCVSKVYVDKPDGTVRAVGWVFEKRMEYEDYRGHGDRYYTRSVWVTVHERAPEVKTERTEFLSEVPA